MKLSGAFIFLLLISGSSGFAQLSSTFDSNDDGWKAVDQNTGTFSAVTYSSSAGNPGGAISFLTTGSLPLFYFDAPAKYIVDLSTSYNQEMKFDLMQSAPGTDRTYADVIINSSGSGTLVYQLPANPASGSWSSYTIPLNETAPGWHISFIAGPVPSRDQMKQILAKPISIRVRLKQFSGNTSAVGGSMDNFSISAPPSVTPPSITSFAPLSGIPNVTTITISGTNFNAAASQNTVWFGGVKAPVVTGSATQLTVKVPAGAKLERITVTNLATGRSGQSAKNFTPLFSNNSDEGGQIIRASMAPRVLIPTDPTPNNKIRFNAGDLDGDSWNDIIVTQTEAKIVSVYRNLGTSNPLSAASFALPITFPLTAPGKGYNVLADFDGDGKLDYITGISDAGGAKVAILRNTSTTGSISFAAAQYQQASSYADGPMQVCDIDGDGRPELLASFDNSSGGASAYFTIFQNISTPGVIDFGAFGDFDFGAIQPGNAISTGDLNGDGKPDIGVVNGFSNSLAILENVSTPGSITLLAPFTVATGGLNAVSFTDVDADGKLDLVYGSNSTYSVKAYKNQYSTGPLSAASFGAQFAYTSPIILSSPTGALTTSDLNGDGKPDLIIPGGTDITILQNNAPFGTVDANSFWSGVPFEGNGGNTNCLTPIAVDFDGDNKPDLLTAEANGPLPLNLYLYRNEIFPAPMITSISPTTAKAGDQVSITGDLFKTGVTVPAGTAALGITSTTPAIASMTSAAITVPSGGISSKVDLTVHGLTSNSKYLAVPFGTNRIIDATSFPAKVSFPLAGNVRDALTVADLDSDGKPDVMVIDNYSVGRIFQNTHTGGDVESSSLTQLAGTFTASYNLISWDIDGDGRQDINTGNRLLRNLSVPGSIAFETETSTYASGFVQAAVGDFNRDGKKDLATADGSLNLNLWENDAQNSLPFLPPGYLATLKITPAGLPRPGSQGDVVVADFDGDGFDDLLTANSFTNNISHFRNLGNKGPLSVTGFAAGVSVATNAAPSGLTANDFDGDGKTDVAVVFLDNASTSMSVYRNTSTAGTISFDAPVLVSCLPRGLHVKSQDLDGDGKAEIVMTHQPNPGPGSFSVFKNTSTSGTIGFAAAVNTNLATHNPHYLEIADINGDKKPDILMVATPVSTGFNALLIYQNSIQGVTITIDEQPSDAAVCPGVDATFTTVASGTTNIQYHWQQAVDSGTLAWDDLSNGNGYGGVSTATLTIRTGEASSPETYRYRCRISGDDADDVFTNDKGLGFLSGCGGAPVIQSVSGNTQPGGEVNIALGEFITDPDNNINYSSLTIVEQPGSGAVASIDGEYNLVVDYAGLTFSGTDTLVVQVCDLTDLCVTRQIFITVGGNGDGLLLVFNGISPDGNGKNDKWIIQNIETLADAKPNHVAIYNRWGDTVFEADNYDNAQRVFTGQGKSGGDLPSGTYYYRITFSSARKTLSGYLSLKR